MIENSPAIYRWEQDRLEVESAQRTTDDGTSGTLAQSRLVHCADSRKLPTVLLKQAPLRILIIRLN